MGHVCKLGFIVAARLAFLGLFSHDNISWSIGVEDFMSLALAPSGGCLAALLEQVQSFALAFYGSKVSTGINLQEK